MSSLLVLIVANSDCKHLVGVACSTYLETWPQTVGVVSSVTAVTQQHVVGVSFTSTDATASVEDGARPEDASLQAGQVDKHLDKHISI